MQEILLRYFERRLSKGYKKVNFIFLLNSIPLNGQDYEKQKDLELVTIRSSGYKINSEKFLYQ